MNSKTRRAVQDVLAELERASKKHSKFNSAHEGWAVIWEELDELWEEIRLKENKRSKKRMRGEAKQVAAMALRFMIDLT